jgi:hypothetical protein
MGMKIKNIYQDYEIPEMLQLHMLRTAAVAKTLIENWTGPKIETENIIATMLLHDMGNVVKMKLDNELHLKDTAKQREQFRNLVEKYQDKYGKDDQEATIKIIGELNIPDRLREMISKMSFRHNHDTVNTDDYSIKICAYSDQIVAPFGIVSLNERMEEANRRYNYIFPKLSNGLTSEILWIDAGKIEKQVLAKSKLEKEKALSYMERLKDFEIPIMVEKSKNIGLKTG